jgi:catechol 2,3-dioxygenase
VRAGHIEYLVTDLKKAEEFYVDTLGFVPTERDSSHLYLRGIEERQHHCFVLSKARRPGVGHMAFRVSREEDLLALERLLREKRCRPAWAKAAEEEGLDRTLRVQDPFGFPIEFYASMKKEDWLLQEFDRQRGAKVMRLDHFNLLLPSVLEGYSWYADVLGFTCTELTETVGRDRAVWGAWMRRKHTCHDVALMTGRGPRVHHAGFTVYDRGAIMDAADILASRGYVANMERGPGRHGISNAFFLYLRDPDGNRIELYTGDYLSSDPDWEPIRWKLNDPRRQTFWGAPSPASWFNEAMLVSSFSTGGFQQPRAPDVVDRPDYLIGAH